MTSKRLTPKKPNNTHQFLAETRSLSIPEIYVPECMSEPDFGNVLLNTLVNIFVEQQEDFVLELPTGYTGCNSREGVYRLRVCAVDFEASK